MGQSLNSNGQDQAQYNAMLNDSKYLYLQSTTIGYSCEYRLIRADSNMR